MKEEINSTEYKKDNIESKGDISELIVPSYIMSDMLTKVLNTYKYHHGRLPSKIVIPMRKKMLDGKEAITIEYRPVQES
jgi:hypothetical protein